MSRQAFQPTPPSQATPGDSDGPALAVAMPLVDVRREPDVASERVTQTLLNVPATVLDEKRGWTRVSLPDYDGWVSTGHLAAAAPPTGHVAVVRAPRTWLYAEASGDVALGPAFATTVLAALDALDGHAGARVRVALPGNRIAWLDGDAVALRSEGEPFPPTAPDDALDLARQFLGTPYLWGGTSAEGFDCSGLVQLCCRAAGRIIPRDADQQYVGIPYIVERGDLQAGDLVFFARGGRVTHVGMMLADDGTYIHAKGSPENRVMLNTLNVDGALYSARLAEMYAGSRRPFTTDLADRQEEADA